MVFFQERLLFTETSSHVLNSPSCSRDPSDNDTLVGGIIDGIYYEELKRSRCTPHNRGYLPDRQHIYGPPISW